ncbi:MAG: TolC family protein [Bacteroidota bacterium]
MKVVRRIFFLTILLSVTALLPAQEQKETLYFALTDLIATAQSEAPGVQISETKLTNNYWFYQSFLANYKPDIDLVATLPNLNRSIREITLPDGTQQFIESAFMSNNIGFRLSQNIALTGGNIFAQTDLERLDQFKTDNNPASTSYLSAPIVLGFNQPFFGFNRLKWDKLIQPLRYQEAQREYSEELEQIAYDAAVFFFDVFNAQISLDAAQRDKANADTLFAISKGRYSVGRIAETELLQIELSAMTADAALSQAMLNLQTASEGLRNFLGISKAVDFDLTAPTDIPEFEVDASTALRYANAHRSKTIEFHRRIKEAEQEIARAKGDNGRNFNLFGRFGLSQTANTLADAYSNPVDQEQLVFGIEFPIADWGKAKARTEVARSNLELERMTIEQERIAFEQEILLRVKQFDLVRRQVGLSLRAFKASEKREEITRKRYLIGKIGITELNLALREQNESRRSYMSALRAYWLAHYQLRNLTLYDFENDRPLLRSVNR